ncbi:predicted protein [Naegleria gruberi]|uniref:Predicted protein n=1 Tax=Naegleria gruberi TaxID=5762 RepID=D2W080_NAEGR|nr:uncharacterized protein NAEGRDRAFT_74763 [Naegleria gruberi]EFC37526.1 predicted protein [Naegleria gruberi]|eukprot:XP_002670270.1 predicted protein [Naegleria gruberi strain NEG-M]
MINTQTNDILAPPTQLIFIQYLSFLMDSSFHITIPIIRKRISFGFDPIFGFVPFVGDFISFGVSCLILIMIWRHGMSFSILCRMGVNIVLDFLIGCIPIIGTIFDFFFKANKRNWKMLCKYYNFDPEMYKFKKDFVDLYREYRKKQLNINPQSTV